MTLQSNNQMWQNHLKPLLYLIILLRSITPLHAMDEPVTYHHFHATDSVDSRRVEIQEPIIPATLPLWAQNVSQKKYDWEEPLSQKPFFAVPIPFVLPPVDKKSPFYSHNHQPSITWLPNGDLMAIWYSTESETGTELTVLASRLRPINTSWDASWDASSEFFKADNRNMHGSSIMYDNEGTIYHFNGMGAEGKTGYAKLALLMRTSNDNGKTWAPPKAIDDRLTSRHQVISGALMTKNRVLIQPCDAVDKGNGGTALYISHDEGKSWVDPGQNQPKPDFITGATGKGIIAGIHAQVVELTDGRLMALGRGDTINGRMPMSISTNLGQTWTYQASEFPPIGSGQRLVLRRLNEGPLLFISFTSGNKKAPEANGMSFTNQNGASFTGHGMYAALSYDDGVTWPVRKLLTPGKGEFNGGAWTGPFNATPTRAEHAGYLSATQTPDGWIHLISSRLYYRFNLAWLLQNTLPEERPNQDL